MSDRHPLHIAALVSGGVFALLLVAPIAPPQAALFAGGGLLMLSVATYFSVQLVLNELQEGWEKADVEGDDEDASDIDRRIEQAQTAYVEGDLTEAEFEARVEEIHQAEDDGSSGVESEVTLERDA